MADVTDMGREVLRVEGLRVERDGQTHLDVPALSLLRGETLAVMGPNGAGKSTLLLVLALLLSPTAGQLWLDGQRVDFAGDLAPLRRRLAVVFQEPLLLNRSVEDNVGLGLRLRGVGGKDVRERVGLWLARFGIAHLARRSARTLSGGEAQRASLARAFVLAPDVLFLDEPFSALDTPTRAALVEGLGEVIKETQVTTVFVTHDRDEALSLGDRLAVMISGRLLQVGLPEQVFGEPSDPAVARFMGVETVVPGRVLAQEEGMVAVDVGGATVEAVGDFAEGLEVLVCLRPEDVTLIAPTTVTRSSARNHLPGRVTRLASAGAQIRVTVDCGFPLVALLTRRSAQELGLEPGSKVVASFKASTIHLIHRA